MEFKAGDVVQLKSGGPAMTIAWIDGSDARCEWFDNKNEPQGRSYKLVALIRYG